MDVWHVARAEACCSVVRYHPWPRQRGSIIWSWKHFVAWISMASDIAARYAADWGLVDCLGIIVEPTQELAGPLTWRRRRRCNEEEWEGVVSLARAVEIVLAWCRRPMRRFEDAARSQCELSICDRGGLPANLGDYLPAAARNIVNSLSEHLMSPLMELVRLFDGLLDGVAVVTRVKRTCKRRCHLDQRTVTSATAAGNDCKLVDKLSTCLSRERIQLCCSLSPL